MKSIPICLCVAAVLCSVANADDAPLPTVPDGFQIEKVAGTPLVKHPMMAGFDDRGRLFIAESSGENLRAADLLTQLPNLIRMIEDTDGDGHFDKSTIFADKLTLPMGALWYRDALYVASPPYIWKLRDTDDDGVADERTILVESFGFSGNAASIHGCFLSPGGRLFWCDGRHGHEHFDARGQLQSKGKAARIFSCKPDGSDVRVFAGGGMDNPVEVDFTETGEVIGTVNILYGRPRIDALVHWIEDGVYPRADQGDSIAEFQRTGELIPPLARMGHVAVSGTTRYRSDGFGPEFQNNFFISVFNSHRVVRSILTPSGSTFTSLEADFVVSENPDFHPTDVLEDADGSLLVIDTGGWFRIGCPTSQIAKPEFHGGIYRVTKTEQQPVDDPRGNKIDWKNISPERLLEHLDDDRFAVRERAIDELAQRNVDFDQFQAVTPRQKRNLIWTEARSDRKGSLRFLDNGLIDEDASVRSTALQAIRELGQFPPLIAIRVYELLASGTPLEKRLSATTLEQYAKTLDQPNVLITEELLKAYETDPLDRHLEHALTHALLEVGHPDVLKQGVPEMTSIAAKRNWLLIVAERDDLEANLDSVLAGLHSSDPLYRQEALRVMQTHPEWIPELSEELRTLLAKNSLTEQEVERVRSVILSLAEDKAIQTVMRETLEREATSESTRGVLMELLPRIVTAKTLPEWDAVLEIGLQSSDPQILRPTLDVLRLSESDKFVSSYMQQFRSEKIDKESRLMVVRAMLPLLEEASPDLLDFVLQLSTDTENTLLSLRAAETLAMARGLSSKQFQMISRRIARFPAHVLPPLFSFVRDSQSVELQSAFLSRVLETHSADRLSEVDLQAWKEQEPATSIVSLLTKLEAARLEATAERRSKLASLTELAAGGNAEKGEQVFLSRRSACAGCHRIESRGGEIGPDLSQIGKIRTGRDLLEAIVFPSASFARGYEPFTVVTDSGRVHNGIIRSETASEIVLLTTDQRAIRIPRDEIELMKDSRVSVMPQGIDRLLTPEELRDLIAYLVGRK